MITWEMADGTEITYEGAGVEPAALREFVLRFMASQSSFWDALQWSDDSLAAAFEERFAQKVGASGGASDPSAISHVYHARQLTDFVQALETGRAPLVDGREGRKAVQVIRAIYESAQTGRIIELK